MAIPPANILIVEDDRAIRCLLTTILTDEGYVIEAVPTVADAFLTLQRWMPDLILLDIRMRDLDGWQFLATYHQGEGPFAPIVVCTATTAYRERSIAAGAVGFLEKPFDLESLLETVESGIAGSKSPPSPPALVQASGPAA